MPNGRGYHAFEQPDKKTQPAKLSDRAREGQSAKEWVQNGHDFNEKAKITNPGGGYSGYNGNAFNRGEKDDSLDYMKSRGEKGQAVSHYSGTHRKSRETTQNIGVTAYNGRPIEQTYKPATSGKVPSGDAIIRPVIKKTEERK